MCYWKRKPNWKVKETINTKKFDSKEVIMIITHDEEDQNGWL